MIAAILLFGFSLGIQETVIKAGIADLTPLKKRGTGYGIFNTMNGVGLLASGAVMGLLYDVSPWAVCWFSAAAEVAGLAVLVVLLRSKKPTPSPTPG
jgi:MFS family permease